MIVHQPKPWTRTDPHVIQRQRWLAVARAEADAADSAGEDYVAAAFRIVVATLEAGRLPDPVRHGRETLKGRAAVREHAVELGRRGLSSRAVALAVGQPYVTVYQWLRKASVVQTRAVWRESVRRND